MGFRLFDFAVEPITLECGVRLPMLPIRGWVWGPKGDWSSLQEQVDVFSSRDLVPVGRDRQELNQIRRLSKPLRSVDCPTVLIVHALTGDAQVGGEGGWWSSLVGPGRPLDPTKMRIVCFNNLGSCYGTFGPGDAGFPTRDMLTGERVGADEKGGFSLPEHRMPAPITTWDGARVIWSALDAVGIDRIHSVVGGSVGGMLALCVAALQPHRVGQVLPIAASAAASPWIIGWNHIARQMALMEPTRGLELARQIAHMTYRAEPGLTERQGRRKGMTSEHWPWPYAVQTYLEHQGQSLRRRFSVDAYLAQLDLMDHHDLSRTPPRPDAGETWSWTPPRCDENWGLQRLTCPVHALSILQDQLYFSGQSQSFVNQLQQIGRNATHETFSSPHGHDGFLIATEPVGAWISKQIDVM